MSDPYSLTEGIYFRILSICMPGKFFRFLYILLAYATLAFSFTPTTFGDQSQQINLTLGQTQRLKLNTMSDRINLSNSTSPIDLFMTDPLTLSIKAVAPGVTNLQIFYVNNTQEVITVVVSPADRSNLQTVENYLGNKLSSYGLKVSLNTSDTSQVQKIQVTGETLKYNEACVTEIIQPFADLVNNKVAYVTPKPILPASANPVSLASASQGTSTVASNISTTSEKKENPLIQIDVVILDVDLFKTKDFGVDWFSGGSSLVFSPQDTLSTTIFTGLSPFNVNQYSAATTINVDHMTLQLRALIENDCAKILATPKLTVRSGEKASFMSGGEVPIVSTTANTSSVTYRKFGTQLDITPIVQPQDMIAVDAKASFSQIDNAIAVAGNPGFSKKEASTSLTIKSGLTFALAGFLERVRNETMTRLPLFGNIPLIGPAFRKNVNTMEEVETLILMTPHILGQQKGCSKKPTIGTPYGHAEIDYMLDDDIFGLNEMANKMEQRVLREDCEGNPIYVDPNSPCPIEYEEDEEDYSYMVSPESCSASSVPPNSYAPTSYSPRVSSSTCAPCNPTPAPTKHSSSYDADGFFYDW